MTYILSDHKQANFGHRQSPNTFGLWRLGWGASVLEKYISKLVSK